jgi:hypothetical protein
LKLYKLWMEIEEFDMDSGEHRNLSEEGLADPVPVAVFSTLGEAQSFAEAFAMDHARPARPWMSLFNTIN